MDAARTNHIIRFGPLTFRPVKGKLKKKTANEFELPLQRNFRFTQQMEAGHVATHMIFHAITADQNARIRILHRGDHRDLAVLRQTLRPPKRSKRIATLDITCSSQSRIFNGTASVYFICFNSILLLTILVI